MATRNTQYDPKYTPPKVDPKQQQGLTNLVSRFGVEYPNAPRATPQLLALMRGLGLNLDLAEDINRQNIVRIEGRSADSMADIARADERRRGSITSGLQQANVLSSGAANTRYARQAEDVLNRRGDVARRSAEGIADSENVLAIGQSGYRQQALEWLLTEEEKQATTEATSKENVRSFKLQLAENDRIFERDQAARAAALQAQIEAWGTIN